MSVQAWFYLVVAIMVGLVMVGSVVAASLLLRTNSAADRLIENIEPARVAAYQLQASLVDQEIGVRGYALTGDPQFLDPYRDGVRRERESTATIRALLPDNEDNDNEDNENEDNESEDNEQVHQDLTALHDAAEAWREDFAEPVITSVVEGQPGSLSGNVVAEATASFDQVREAFEAQNATLASLAQSERSDLDRARTYRDWVLISMVVAFVAAVALMLLLVRMMVLRPLSARLDHVRGDRRRHDPGAVQ